MIRTDDMKDGHPILWAEILYDILYIHAAYIYLCEGVWPSAAIAYTTWV